MIKTKIPFYAFLVSVFIAIPLRLIQLSFAIEPDTGFYKEGHISVPLLTFVIIATFIILIVLPFLLKPEYVAPDKSELRLTGAFGVILGISLFIVSIFNFLAIDETELLFEGMYFTEIFGILSGVYFVVLGIKLVVEKGPLKSLLLFSLVPIIWSTMKLFISFVQYTMIANISEILFEVLSLAFFPVFLYGHARIITNIKSKFGFNIVISFGLLSSFFGLVSTLPKYIAVFFKISTIPITNGLPDFLNLTLSLYIIVFIVGLIFKDNSKPMVEEVVCSNIEIDSSEIQPEIE